MSIRRMVRQNAWLLVLASAAALQAAADPRQPDYYPTCPSPQPSAPAQPGGGSLVRSNVVWNGREYAMVWIDGNDSRLHFRRIFADGTPAAPSVTVTSRTAETFYAAPSLVWNGTGYAVAWVAYEGSSAQDYFARLGPDGALIGTEVQVSFVGQSGVSSSNSPVLAWNGSGYAVVWDRGNIYATLLDEDGMIVNGGLAHDLVISNGVDFAIYPSMAATAGGGYYIAWDSWPSNSSYRINGAYLPPDGTPSGNSGEIVSGAGNAHLIEAGGQLGMVWSDWRDGRNEMYFNRFDLSWSRLGPDVRLTNDPANRYLPRIAWTGAEFGVVWFDWRTGNAETWFQRVSVDGVPVGGNVQVTHAGNGNSPDIAFGRYGYLITTARIVQAWGCNTISAPPGCAGGYVAYGISGTNATVGWLPADAPLADIAYYNVYRNAVLVGKTSANAYNDSGLSPGVTYAYSIQPVDSFQNRNSSCTAIIYVRSNASLTLKMDKSNLNALLNWTDAGLASYNIFRGTDPRVMQQIGATPALSSSDANALTGPVNYFYTVDDPGM